MLHVVSPIKKNSSKSGDSEYQLAFGLARPFSVKGIIAQIVL